MNRPGVAWTAVAVLLSACALLGWPLPKTALDWQPALALEQPWRSISAVAVHYSRLHLLANLAGAAVVAAFGLAARLPARAAWAWLAAWPLTQFGLAVETALTHFGGLSGVLHAGVVIASIFLVARGRRAERVIGLLVLLGCAAKVFGEAPWGPPLRHPAGWDIATAPIAHASGCVAGALCGLLVVYRRPWRAPLAWNA